MFSRVLDTSNKITSLLLKSVLIVVLVLGVFWIGISVYANLASKHQQQQVTIMPTFPAVEKAKWAILIKATGETILSNSEQTVAAGRYLLHGYYELNTDNQWAYHKADLTLDEKRFGPIILTGR